MFFNRQKLIDAENEIAGLKNEVQSLKDELENTQFEKQLIEQKIASTADSDSFYNGLFQLLQEFGNSMISMQGSLASLASVMTTEKDHASNTAKVLTDTHQAVSTISTSLSAMASDIENTASTVEGLNRSAGDIEGIINLIKNISDQTNLLALNAAIEAARAGEQGRGFAVVADEVRTLAKRTNDATIDIESLVSTIRVETNNAKQQMDEVASNSSGFGEIGGQASSKMDQLVSLSTQMQGVISGSALRSFVEVVKLDHLIYKMEIYKVIMGVSNKSLHDFSGHLDCRLGKWYYHGDGKDLFSGLNGFRELESPHQTVHQSGVNAIECMSSEDKTGALAALKIMENASMDVLDKLENLALSAEKAA